MPPGGRADGLRGHDLEFISDEHRSEAHQRNLWKAMEVSVRTQPEEEQPRFAELACSPMTSRSPRRLC
jgi:hypothetical protein